MCWKGSEIKNRISNVVVSYFLQVELLELSVVVADDDDAVGTL